jgi:beta-lactamase class A
MGYLAANNENQKPLQLLIPQPQISDMPKPTIVKNSKLTTIIENKLPTIGTYAVFVKNLSTNETYTNNQNLQLPAASLYKLWIMAETYNQIQSGDLNKNEILRSSIPDLNSAFKINPNEAELTTGLIYLSVNDALEQMITISHNYAALLLVQKLSLPKLQEFLANNKFTSSTIGEGSLTTASDIAKFYEQLYLGKIINSESSSQMLSLLKRQTLNNKIPKYLPPNLSIAHKTGELDDVTHDAGIVYSPKATYIIVVLTQTDNPTGANENISQISKAVYDYYNP